MSRIKLYRTPPSKTSDEIENFLKRKGVEYEKIDVSRDKNLLKEMKKKSGSYEVPVLEIGDEVLIGFNGEKISKLIKYL